MAQQPAVGQGLLTVKPSRSHSDTPHSVGLLWTSDQPVAETSTRQHTTLTKDRHPRPRRDSNPQSQQASGRRPHGLDRECTGIGAFTYLQRLNCVTYWKFCVVSSTQRGTAPSLPISEHFIVYTSRHSVGTQLSPNTQWSTSSWSKLHLSSVRGRSTDSLTCAI